jgi:aspartate aminotransferase-like enzyme
LTMLLMTPGPTRVPDPVLRAGAGPMIHHRDAEFSKHLSAVLDGLRPLFGTEGDILPIHATGRGAMEAAICNLLSPGDHLLAICNGRFGEMWAEIAESFGLLPHRVCPDWNSPADAEEILNAIDTHPQARAVLAVHSDTSTGGLNDIAPIAAAARSRGLLVLVDAVSSVGGVLMRFDEWGIDIAVTASQKCLMSSPGLAFAALSERAWKACETAGLPRAYFDFRATRKALRRAQPQTPGTTPVHLVLQLEAALSLIHEEGPDQTFARHETMSRMVRQWASERRLLLQCPNLLRYSPTLTALRIPAGLEPQRVRDRLKAEGILIARGIGPYESNSIRIGHMGDIRPADVELTLERLGAILGGTSR